MIYAPTPSCSIKRLMIILLVFIEFQHIPSLTDAEATVKHQLTEQVAAVILCKAEITI